MKNDNPGIEGESFKMNIDKKWMPYNEYLVYKEWEEEALGKFQQKMLWNMKENIIFKSSHSAKPAYDEVLYKIPEDLKVEILENIKILYNTGENRNIIISDYIIIKIEK